jgi:cobalt-precorrin 5A hydrolase
MGGAQAMVRRVAIGAGCRSDCAADAMEALVREALALVPGATPIGLFTIADKVGARNGGPESASSRPAGGSVEPGATVSGHVGADEHAANDPPVRPEDDGSNRRMTGTRSVSGGPEVAAGEAGAAADEAGAAAGEAGASCLIEAARRLGVELVGLPAAALRDQSARVVTPSPGSERRFGVPSVAEAAALAGAGAGARLLARRIAARGATCAIAGVPDDAPLPTSGRPGS